MFINTPTVTTTWTSTSWLWIRNIWQQERAAAAHILSFLPETRETGAEINSWFFQFDLPPCYDSTADIKLVWFTDSHHGSANAVVSKDWKVLSCTSSCCINIHRKCSAEALKVPERSKSVVHLVTSSVGVHHHFSTVGTTILRVLRRILMMTVDSDEEGIWTVLNDSQFQFSAWGELYSLTPKVQNKW